MIKDIRRWFERRRLIRERDALAAGLHRLDAIASGVDQFQESISGELSRMQSELASIREQYADEKRRGLRE